LNNNKIQTTLDAPAKFNEKKMHNHRSFITD